MSKLIAWLNGKKTYILAGLAALTALVNFISMGNFSLQGWIEFINTEAIAGAFAALRAGLKKSST